MKIKVYYDPVTKGFYQSDLHSKIPTTAVEITNTFRWELVKGLAEGGDITMVEGVPLLSKPQQNDDQSEYAERAWRDSQLLRADIELNKVQDSDPKAVGSVSDWRAYRKALRAWPEHKDFPNKEKRPVSPDA